LLNRKESTDILLEEVFEQRRTNEQTSYVANNFYSKNSDKYFSSGKSEEGKTTKLNQESLALPYLDSFLTRYIYHHFRRWFTRVGQWAGRVE
jgi:hypothetical protein